jgi:hypothetical protein
VTNDAAKVCDQADWQLKVMTEPHDLLLRKAAHGRRLSSADSRRAHLPELDAL